MSKTTVDLEDLAGVTDGFLTVIACLVKTANEMDPEFQERFLMRIDKQYGEVLKREDSNLYPLSILFDTIGMFEGVEQEDGSLYRFADEI